MVDGNAVIKQSILPFSLGNLGDEGKEVGLLLDVGFGRGAATVPLVDVDSHQYRVVYVHRVACLVLQLGHVLIRMQRDNSIVMITCRNEHRRVLLLLDVVQGRVVYQEVVGAGLVGESVLGLPEVATGELVEPEHVCYRHLRNGGSEQIRPLVGSHGDERAAVGATEGDEALVIGEALLLQVLRSRNEVIEAPLPVLLDRSHVPLLTEFAASSNAGDNMHTA